MAGNSKSGRKAKPAIIREREGNRSRTPIPTPPKTGGKPKKPRGLETEATKMWNEIVPTLVSIDLAEEIDTPMLWAMCEWWQVYRDLQNMISQTKEIIAEGPQRIGLEAFLGAQDAYGRLVSKMATASKEWQRIAGSFGLDPAARQKLATICETTTPGDPAEAYFAS